MWHDDFECQVCDVFEDVSNWGPAIAPEEHAIVYYPDYEPIVRDFMGIPICLCTDDKECRACRERHPGS